MYSANTTIKYTNSIPDSTVKFKNGIILYREGLRKMSQWLDMLNRENYDVKLKDIVEHMSVNIKGFMFGIDGEWGERKVCYV